MSVPHRALFALASLLLLSRPVIAQADPDGGLAADAGSSGTISIHIDTSDDEDDQGVTNHSHHRHHGGHNNRVNVGGSVTVKEGETVDDAVAVGGALEVQGRVRGDAVAVGGPLHVSRGGHVEGDVVAIGGPLQLDDGAVVDGEHVSIATMLGMGGLAGVAGALGTLAILWMIVSTLVSVLGVIALGALFVAFIPERLERMRHVLIERPWPSLGAGLLAFLGIVPATILLAITIVGILLIPFLWMAFGLLIALGLAIVSQLIGEKLLRGTAYEHGPVATLALGALVLALVRLVPYLGSLAFAVAMVGGVGAVLLARGGERRNGSGTPPPPVPAPQSVPPASEPPADPGDGTAVP